MKKPFLKKPFLFLFISLIIVSLLHSDGVTALSQPADDAAVAENENTVKDPAGEIYLHAGSPLILSRNEILPLDSENLDVAATVVNDRTLVPIQPLSEYFNAGINYDSINKNVTVSYAGKKYLFPLNSKKYIRLDGKTRMEILMDAQTAIINGRTMVPLKVICEDILGRKVNYYDDVIAISANGIDLEKDSTLIDYVKSKIGSAIKVQSLDQLKASISLQNNYNGITGRSYAAAEQDTAEAGVLSEEATSAKSIMTDDAGHSVTNTQVQGIDEADIVKTDGSYIYISGRRAVRIVSAKDGNMKDVSSIKLAEDKSVNEIYIDKGRLVILGTRYERQVSDPVYDSNAKSDAISSKMLIPRYSKNYSFVDIYNISDPQNPVFIKGHEMEGNYNTSRKNGNIVYLITNTYVYQNILPVMKDTVAGNQYTPLEIKDVMIMPGHRASGYVVVSAVNIFNNDKTEIEAVTTSGHMIYMNGSSLYLAASDYNGLTEITKFRINGMNMGYAGSGKVNGYVLNQFSMDEYGGNFRVATTGDNDNNLFILDNSLNVCGSVTGLAKGERIYSVRFMEDKGYIVTFRTIDPLFVFDLSDPKNPKVTGELKIPGFSNYLHPVGENKILGVGQDTYEIYRKDSSGKEVVVGTRQGGIKLSLFDVSDMGKPKEISNYVLGDSGSYTDLFYDHKAAMFDYNSNTVVFDATYTDEASDKYKHGAVVFNYGDSSLKLKGVLDYIEPEVSGIYIPYGRRAVYIGNVLYYIQDGIISSYNYETLTPIQTLVLK